MNVTPGTTKQRFKTFVSPANKTTPIEYGELTLGSSASINEPFLAGQYWCCFELIAPGGRTAGWSWSAFVS